MVFVIVVIVMIMINVSVVKNAMTAVVIICRNIIIFNGEKMATLTVISRLFNAERDYDPPTVDSCIIMSLDALIASNDYRVLMH